MALSDLDLFILALVERGLGTPYDFKVRAGLSVGTASPVLARMEKAGYLKGVDTGVRDSRRFSITKSGEKILRSGWEALLETRPTDIEVVLRIVFLAWAHGRKDAATKFLERSSFTLSGVAGTRKAEASQLEGMLPDEVGGEAFRWLRTESEAARLQAQAEVLKKLIPEIKNKKTK